jgi:isocitrate/isopropylmalate dehydrogenase
MRRGACAARPTACSSGAARPNTSAVVGWLRWEMDAWGGVRPAKFLPGDALPLADPAGIEFMVIRGNSEGIYPGREGDLADLKRALPDLRDTLDRCDEGRFAAKVVTRKGTEPARLASELARKPQGALSRQTHLRDQVQRFSANRRALPANDPGELNKTVLVSSESLGA